MSPSLISIMRLTIRMAVVLPQPDGPTSTQISPAGTSSERSSTAGFGAPGYCFVTDRNSMLAAVALSAMECSPLAWPPPRPGSVILQPRSGEVSLRADRGVRAPLGLRERDETAPVLVPELQAGAADAVPERQDGDVVEEVDVVVRR